MSKQSKEQSSLHEERFHATGDKPKYPEAVYEFAEEFSDGAYGASSVEETVSKQEELGIDVERKQKEKQVQIKQNPNETV